MLAGDARPRLKGSISEETLTGTCWPHLGGNHGPDRGTMNSTASARLAECCAPGPDTGHYIPLGRRDLICTYGCRRLPQQRAGGSATKSRPSHRPACRARTGKRGPSSPGWFGRL